MECLYYSELDYKTEYFFLPNIEAKHAKALRLKLGDEVLISNGKGTIANCFITSIDKYSTELKVQELIKNMNENIIKVHAAIGLLDNKDRFEFALEKSVELGCIEFTPIISDYSSKKKYNYERLEAKALAAMKQSKRSILPKINQPTELIEIIAKNNLRIILADENGSKNLLMNEDSLILVGPEGGFSENEISLIEQKKSKKISLGKTRLRAETALIATLSKILL